MFLKFKNLGNKAVTARIISWNNFSTSKKIFADSKSALEGLEDGNTILLGGFGLAGIPENSILEIKRRGVKNLTAVSNTGGIFRIFEKHEIYIRLKISK
jgi:hypothetical protein